VYGSRQATALHNDSANDGENNQTTYDIARLHALGLVHADQDRTGVRPECGPTHIRWVGGNAGSVGVARRRWRPVRDAGTVPGDLHVLPSVVIPEGELRWRFSRSSGPGGQSVNTTDSRVELSWDLADSPVLSPALRERALQRLSGRLVDGVLTVTASEHRSQLRNRTAAERRLAGLVAEAIAPPARKRRPTRPSKGANERRIAEKTKGPAGPARPV
jgi:ribosome-associated protein